MRRHFINAPTKEPREMKASAWLTRLLAIGSVLEGALALALFVDSPRVASILLQSRLDATGEIVANIAGGALLALSIACWLARRTPTAPASRGVAWALFAYNLAASLALAQAAATPAHAVAVLHGVFGAFLLLALVRTRHSHSA
jgi:hypothetical protein